MKYLILFVLIYLSQFVSAQTALPIINANSKKVAIRDGDYLDSSAWSLSPKIKPDIYTADRTRESKWVVFYTDIDSIRVMVKPGSKFDFVVLLNGRDSCFTRITSAIAPESMSASGKNTHDTIPFELTSYNAIKVKALINERDSLNLHFDVGSFGFAFTKSAILNKARLLSGQPDAIAGKTNPDFNKMEKVHTLKIANTTWKYPEVRATGLAAHDMDGKFGWDLFEGRVVEIDYDKNLLIIHSKMPAITKGYIKSHLKFMRSFVCMNAVIEINRHQYKGDFLLDTGSDQAMILDSTWLAYQHFPMDLKLIKSSAIRDPRGNNYETKTVGVPQLQLNQFKVNNIPTMLLGTRNPTGFEVNFFGNDLMKRFNTILDFANDLIYLKPNHLMNVAFRNNS